MQSKTLLPFSQRVAVRSRGYLPHWEADDAIYFITYRLADSVPQSVLTRLRQQYRVDQARGMTGPMASRRLSRRMNKYLRAGSGECLLRQPSVAELIIDTWRHFDGERYRLIAWCVMPNQVHVIVQLFSGSELGRVVHSWKSYTSKVANRLLARAGEFWARDYEVYPRRTRTSSDGALRIGESGEGGTRGVASCWLRRLVAGAPAGKLPALQKNAAEIGGVPRIRLQSGVRVSDSDSARRSRRSRSPCAGRWRS